MSRSSGNQIATKKYNRKSGNVLVVSTPRAQTWPVADWAETKKKFQTLAFRANVVLNNQVTFYRQLAVPQETMEEFHRMCISQNGSV